MIKHPTTPFTDHYSYPEVQVRKGLIPYSDLKARGQYDRWLELPRDIIPVLDIPTVQAPNEPKLVTGQNDGSVNVHVMNQSGGTFAPLVIGSTDGPSTVSIKAVSGTGSIIPDIAFAKTIFMIDVVAVPAFLEFTSSQHGFVDVAFHDPAHFTTLNVGAVEFAQGNSAPSGISCGHMQVIFPGGFNIAPFFAGATQVDLIGTLAGANANWAEVSGTLWYGV